MLQRSTTTASAAILSFSPLESIATEVLDQVVPFLDPKSLLTLCHALPRLKHISEAIYNIGSIFKMSLEYLWPDFWFPAEFTAATDIGKKTLPRLPITPSSGQIHYIAALAKLVTLYGGSIKIQAYSLEYLESIGALLPKAIHLYCAAAYHNTYTNYHGISPYESILKTLKKWNLQIEKLDVPYTEDSETAYLDCAEFKNISQSVVSLRCFIFGDGTPFPSKQLLEYKKLSRIEFDGDDGYEIPKNILSDCLEVVANHSALKCIVFENISAVQQYSTEDYDSEFLENARSFKDELKKVGWTCYDGVGDIYGNACVVWEKANASRK
ncbi:UNVERIFIED_CONTAM: hypothetical protein HDU68_011786 [Siphonaria sp. JEL0065]|nr:hypothetical protein HDU68_011786 [Siphonaria sp. JEL0065]